MFVMPMSCASGSVPPIGTRVVYEIVKDRGLWKTKWKLYNIVGYNYKGDSGKEDGNYYSIIVPELRCDP